ncbi:putative Zn finger protein [Kribbella amoyensis]|uniref:Putative Zn finger protein n=1 Tax=Kribbella amoyensis TaxID=996641 RepID=A0A561B2U3_9ACTN|nr:SWIM zinc finger family protein [Kribbella amoyensis]TWD73178.1 putative Zn finger protein [Kribbella amoyensis]
MSPEEERTPWRGWRTAGENAGLPAAKGAGSRRPFGLTWWGKAWLDALEHRARLDPNRLGRGRSYARRGSVLDLTVDPGAVHATVQGSRVTPYEVTVKIRAFTDAEWDAVLDVVSAQIGRVAALLDGELPPEVVDDVQAAGLELLPEAGDLRTSCNCPDFAVPCKHSAAVCYLVADALDEDPFALLLLRGRRRDELLSALRARRAANQERPAVKARPVGVPARAAFLRTERPAVPRPPLPMSQPGVPAAVLALEPPRSSRIEARDLIALATDTANRAWEFAAGDGSGGLELTVDQDLARRAAGVLGTAGLADLAHRAGMSARVLTGWAVAWREGGAGGLAVLVDSVVVEPGALAEGEAVLGAGASVSGNQVTKDRRQLRLGADGLWYLFTEQFGDWMLAAPPGPDPADLLGP